MRTTILTATLLLWVSGSAFAQAVPAPPVATPTDVGLVPAPDAALLDPLLATLAAPNDKRAKVAQRLANLSDPRTIVALRYAALHDRTPEVVDVAVLLLGHFNHPDAVPALVAIALGNEDVRPHKGALDALSKHPQPAGVEALYAITKDHDADTAVRRDALAVLNRDHPDLLTARGAPVLGGSALLATVGGGYFGGFALASVGTFAGNNDAGGIGWVAGTIIGAGTGYIFGRQLSDERQQYYVSALAWGAWSGTLAAWSLEREPVDTTSADGQFVPADHSRFNKTVAGLSLLGELGGLGLAVYGADALRMSSSDVLVTDITGIASTIATAGALGLVTPREDRRPGYATLLGGGLLGVGVGVAAAPHLHFTTGDTALSVYAAAEGGYYGNFLVDLLLPQRPQENGVLLGGGLGLLVGGAVAQYTDLRVGNVGEMLLFSSYGKALGAGLSLMGDAHRDTVNLVHLGFGAAGMATAAYLADTTVYSSGDRAVVPIGTLLGLWHGGWLGSLANEFGTNRGGDFVSGTALTGASLLGIGSIALAQSTNLSNIQATMGSTGAFWGAWFAGWTMALEDNLSGKRVATEFLVGTDLGLATTIALLSPLVDLDPRVLAGANFGGMAAAGLSSLFAAMFSTDKNLVIKANLGGSALGLVAGGLIARAALADAPPVAKGGSLSLPAWMSLPVRGLAAVPHFDAGGRPDGMVVQATLGR